LIAAGLSLMITALTWSASQLFISLPQEFERMSTIERLELDPRMERMSTSIQFDRKVSDIYEGFLKRATLDIADTRTNWR
jgi:hypothetical protein